MQYNSWLYLIFFLGPVLLVYYLVPMRIRWMVLLAASTAFYLLSSRILILWAALSAAVIYAAALAIDRRNELFNGKKKELPKEERKLLKAKLAGQKGKIEAAAVVCNLGILFFVKYFNFAAENLNILLSGVGASAQIPTLQLLMPLGISFYTLSAVSYVVEVNRGVIKAERNYLKLFLFLTFFPTITEGPISRYSQLGGQLTKGNTFDYRQFTFGAQLILWGLFKKVVIADRMNRLIGSVFDHHERYSGLPVVVAVLLYTFQIYMDFSGCIDIVRGSAQMFGIELEENFRQPFFAVSVNDFWRRWHITLGAWLRDYIFYPVSLSKPFQNLSRRCRGVMNYYYAATIPALFALFGVWLGNGIWHGAEWKYIVYGMYYYVIMAAGMLLEPLFQKLMKGLKLHREQKGYRVFQTLRTFILVNIGMLIFRAPDLTSAREMLLSVFEPYTKLGLFELMAKKGMGKVEFTFIVLCVAAMFFVGLMKERGKHMREWIASMALPVRWGIYMAAVVIIVVLGAYGPGFGAADFIYAQF